MTEHKPQRMRVIDDTFTFWWGLIWTLIGTVYGLLMGVWLF